MTRNIDELTPGRFGTVVDCIFGTGFKGAPKEPYLTAIRKINESGAYIISVDINSGLGGDSGIADGEVVRSDLTVSIGCRKSGLYMNYAKDYIKKLVNCDIGIDLLDEPGKACRRPGDKAAFCQGRAQHEQRRFRLRRPDRRLARIQRRRQAREPVAVRPALRRRGGEARGSEEPFGRRTAVYSREHTVPA